jgi:hypothetical protein
MVDVEEEVDKPNAPLVWHDSQGRNLCGSCAEGLDDISDADVFENWKDYNLRCALCDDPFVVDPPTFGEWCADLDVSTDDREAWKEYTHTFGQAGIEASE